MTDPSAVVSLAGFGVGYPHEAATALGPLDLEIRRGERLLLLGPSGSGKSTLALALLGILPHAIRATLTGRAAVLGEAIDRSPPAERGRRVGLLFQDPARSFCTLEVEDEIAFALENRGMPADEIERRIDRALAEVGLGPGMRGRETRTLSGGEQQLVALAAVLAAEPEILILDEPTAALAPAAMGVVHRLLAELAPGRTILVIDHRLDGLMPLVDRVAVLDRAGRLLTGGAPETVFHDHADRLAERGIWRPEAADLAAHLRRSGVALPERPLTMPVMAAALDRAAREDGRVDRLVEAWLAPRRPPAAAAPGAPLVRLEDAACAPFRGPVVLSEIDLTLHAGEVLGLVGPNGVGKTTLGLALAGLERLRAGRRDGPIGGLAFQNPDHQAVGATVADDLKASLTKGRSDADAVVEATLHGFGLDGLAHRHPASLSQGQKRCLALAALTLAADWPFLVLDEPTAGLDAAGAAEAVRLLRRLEEEGRALVIVSHDMELIAALCRRVAVVAEGGIAWDGPAHALFADPGRLDRWGLARPAWWPVEAWRLSRDETSLSCLSGA